jgi:Bcr/CflA subfamily drug resistance transporter
MLRLKSPPLWLLMMLVCFPQLSETIYTPSLPDLAADLAVSNSLAQWTLSIYFVGFALGVAFWGNYSDSIGRRKAILKGLILYFCASLGCFFSSSIFYLLVFRAVQAFGISVGSVVVQSILREVYQGKARSDVFARLTVAMAFSPAVGPFLGGWMASWLGWKSNFLILSFLVAGLFFLCLRFLHETCKQEDSHNRWKDLMGLSRQIFSNYKVLTFAILIALLNGIMFSYYSHAPFIFVNLLNLTEKQYGILGLLVALGVFIGSMLSVRLGKKWAPEKVIQFGSWGCFFSILLLNIHVFFIYKSSLVLTNILLIMFPMILFFLFFTVTIPSLLGTALQDFASRIGGASSIFGCIYYTFTAFFNFLMGVFDNKTVSIMPVYFIILSFSVVFLFTIYKFSRKELLPVHETYEH